MKSNQRGALLLATLGSERGVALIVTLFVVALVTVLVVDYHFEAAVELELAANYAADVQAYHLALAGVQVARVLLQQDDAAVDGPHDLWYTLGQAPVCLPPEQLLAMAEQAETALPAAEAESGETRCLRLRIGDEAGKLPLNALVPPPTPENAPPNADWLRIFEAFFASFGLEPEKLEALLDWLDADDVPRLAGAESSYYGGLEPPYAARNGPMHTAGELRLVRGFDAETLAKLFPGLPPQALADLDLDRNAYLTPYGGAGEAKVNLNTALPEVLQALFGGLLEGMAAADELVQEVLARRQEASLESLGVLDPLLPDGTVRTRLRQVADVKGSYFRVEATGEVGAIRKRVVAVLKREGGAVSLVFLRVE
ncbi:MAG: type II secretion system protein K [Candidatus Tectimicrobiota bacterium]|nr:MAG: type II secretion system protein K [Candidatus Tectomicrobia bacterium]